MGECCGKVEHLATLVETNSWLSAGRTFEGVSDASFRPHCH